MEPFLLTVGSALLLALLLGELVERLGQPSLLGEIAAGVLLGPHLLGIIDPEGSFALFATIGAVLLFFDVGYEGIDLHDLLHAGRPAAIIAIAGMAVPGATGYALARGFGYALAAGLFFGLLFAVTSIAVTVRTLMHLDRLDTTYGVRIVGAAVIDDVIGLVALALLVLFVRGQSLLELGTQLGLIAGFFLVAGGFAMLVHHVSSLLDRSVQRGADVLAILGFTFLFGYFADVVGLTASLGAFVVGLTVGAEERFDRLPIREEFVGIAYGLFIPLFFASIGAQLDVSLLTDLSVFVVAVVACGVGAKVLGGYLGARLARVTSTDAVVVGIGLVPKSEVGLVVAGLAHTGGYIDDRLFSAFLALLLVSVVTTPPLLKRAIRRANHAAEAT